MKKIDICIFPLKLRDVNGQKKVFDAIRKKYVAFTPEEFVRQNIILHLINVLKYSINNIAVEYPLKHFDSTLRCDIVVFNKNMRPKIIIECKAPGVKIEQKVIDQASLYNSKLRVSFLAVSNGNETYCCKVDFINHSYKYLDNFPERSIINF